MKGSPNPTNPAPTAAAPEPAAARTLSLGPMAALAVVVAAAVLGAWLWSRICRFPSIPWNDMRLAPTVAFAQGLPVYATASDGPVGTWMYGPLPLLFFWPASWARNAADALMIAAVLNVALTLVPLALVCFKWPAAEGAAPSRLGRASALVLCLALWPELHYSVHFSDNLAVACGLVGNLVLVRASGTRERWFAAIAATAALACKQISLGIPLAQIVWLGVAMGPREGALHALRCAAAGVVMATLAILAFGWEELWFTLVKIPAGIGWAPDPAARLLANAPELALLVGVPAAIMLIFRRAFARPALLLPAITWMCTLPLGFAGMLKLGGYVNSIHGFVLWLPAVLAYALIARAPERRRQIWALTSAGAALAIATGRVLTESDFPLRPNVAPYRQAERIAASSRGMLWFPLHPLVTLYSDRRYYHDEDGLWVHLRAGKPVAPEQMAGHLPPAMRSIVIHNTWPNWSIVAHSMLPPNSRHVDVGYWTVWTRRETGAQP
jgi:hypothetical protein